MANVFYSHGIKHFARGNILWLAAGGSDVKCALVDGADYTVSQAHEFHSSLAGIEETSGNLTKVDAADDGICDASDVTFLTTAGDACELIIMWKDTGVSATSPLLAAWDTAGGLPVTLGGDVTVSWDNGANKVFKI